MSPPRTVGSMLEFIRSLLFEVGEDVAEEAVEGGDLSDGVVDGVTDTLEDEL